MAFALFESMRMADLFSPPAKVAGEPLAMMALGRGEGGDFLLVGCLVLGIVAMAAVVGVFSQRTKAREAARVACARGRTLAELLRTIRMAENIADLGVWQYVPATGVQDWSEGMRAIFGIEHDDPFVPGDAETVLCANNIDLVGAVMLHHSETDPYELRFDMDDSFGSARTISVQACNLRNESGSVVRIIAVVRDVTEEVARERQLEHSRAQMACSAKLRTAGAIR